MNKPKIDFWIYPGSRAGYISLLRLLPIIQRFDKEQSIGNFDINFAFPVFSDQINSEDDQTMRETKKERMATCYNSGRFCSVGLLDGTQSLFSGESCH